VLQVEPVDEKIKKIQNKLYMTSKKSMNNNSTSIVTLSCRPNGRRRPGNLWRHY